MGWYKVLKEKKTVNQNSYIPQKEFVEIKRHILKRPMGQRRNHKGNKKTFFKKRKEKIFKRWIKTNHKIQKFMRHNKSNAKTVICS